MSRWSRHISIGEPLVIDGEEFIIKPLGTEYIGLFLKVMKAFSGASKKDASVEDIFANVDDAFDYMITYSADIRNNIVLSNSSAGLYGPAGAHIAYNVSYGNAINISGTIDVGPYNITNQNPLLDTISSFTITSVLSPAVD